MLEIINFCFLSISLAVGICFWLFKNYEMYNKALKIHEEVITIDTHCDIDLKNFTDDNNYSSNTDSQVNIQKINKGGLDVPWLVVYTAQDSLNENSYRKAYKNAIDKFDAIHRLIYKYSNGQLELATSSSEIFDIIKLDKKAIMIGVENAYPIGENIEIIENFMKEEHVICPFHTMVTISSLTVIQGNMMVHIYMMA